MLKCWASTDRRNWHLNWLWVGFLVVSGGTSSGYCASTCSDMGYSVCVIVVCGLAHGQRSWSKRSFGFWHWDRGMKWSRFRGSNGSDRGSRSNGVSKWIFRISERVLSRVGLFSHGNCLLSTSEVLLPHLFRLVRGTAKHVLTEPALWSVATHELRKE